MYYAWNIMLTKDGSEASPEKSILLMEKVRSSGVKPLFRVDAPAWFIVISTNHFIKFILKILIINIVVTVRLLLRLMNTI